MFLILSKWVLASQQFCRKHLLMTQIPFISFVIKNSVKYCQKSIQLARKLYKKFIFTEYYSAKTQIKETLG